MHKWLVRFYLWRIGRRAKPSARFVRALEARFVSPRHTVSLWVRWKIAIVSFVIIFVFGGGTAVYAYQSDDVLPGSPLYPVRLSLERIELAFAPTFVKKELVRVKQIRRRMRETKFMGQQHLPLAKEGVEDILRAFHGLAFTEAVSTGTQEALDIQARRSLQEVLWVQKRELSEMMKRRVEAETLEDATDASDLIARQADEIDQELRLLGKGLRKERQTSNPQTPEDSDEIAWELENE